jgi:peptide deformylase
VKGLDLLGHDRIVEGTALLARAFQHEMGHLERRLFLDCPGGIQRELIVRRIGKLTGSSTSPASVVSGSSSPSA